MEKQNSQIFRPWNICIVRKGHIESGTHLRQNIVGRIWKKTCLGFLGRKKFWFSAGAVEWGGGEAARGLLPPGFYGGREGRMGTGKGRRREGRCYSEPKPRQLGRNAGVVFTTNSPKSICYANLHSSHSPIHPNQYANLLLGKVRVRCRGGGGLPICSGWESCSVGRRMGGRRR